MKRAIIILALALLPLTASASGFALPGWLEWLLGLGFWCEANCSGLDPMSTPPKPPASAASEVKR